MGIFDDIPSSGGRKGTFDDIPDNKPDGGLLAAAKQGIGQSIKGIGQAASDFIPGVSPQNPISQYGQSVVDANQTAVNSLGGIVDSPWTAVKEAVGNAAGSMGAMLGARMLGTGITAAAPFTGLAAPVVAGAGQIIANVGPIAAAALPSYSGIRETQIAADQGNETDARSKAIAALGAATVGAIETKFGPQEWALSAMKKGGFSALKDKLGAETLRGAVGKGLVKGAAIEGAEELVQNPIEQLSGYQNPTTPEALQETAFGGAMGAIGGGVVGGGVSGIAHFAEKPKGPLQKAAEASSATVPPEAATIPPGGQTSATIPPEAAQPAGIPAGTVPADPETQPPAAGIASADQNTPAAPGISPVPVSTAEPPLPSNQAESAGVPVVDQQAPLSGEYLPASDGRAPFVSAGEIETGAIPGQFSRVYPDTGQRRISQTRSITDQSQEGAAKSGNETEIPQPAEAGQQAKPASVSDSARLDREKDAEALATEAARLREMAARAVGQNRIRLTDLAGRMEAAREAIVGQAGATNKDSLTVEGKAPAVTSQSPPGKFDDAIDAVVKARAKLTPIRDSAESDSDAERTNALINDVGKASLGDLQAMIRIELASKKKQNAGVKVELENVLRAGSSRLRQRAIDAVKSVRSPDSTGDPWLTVSPVVKRIVDKWGQAHSADASKGSGMSPKSVSGTPGNPENPETGKNGKSGTSGKSEDEPVRGAVGMKLSAGQVVTTLTGRTTTPFPKFQSSTGKMTQAHLNAVDRWLLSNAAEEAESRGDDFNALPFRRALESKTIPQADKDSAEMYLFEWQPDVIKPITRPLVPESKSPPVAANETATDAPQAPLSSAEAPQASDDDRKADLEKRRSDLEAKRKQPTTPPNMRRDDLVGAILRVTGGNGVHSSMAPDTVGDSANRATKLRGLFTNRGTADLGEVAMLLRESENFDVRDGEHLAELIRQASFGDVPVSMSRQERDAESAKEKQHRDRIRAMARKYGVRSVGVKFSELESRVFAMMDARNKKAIAALDERAQKRFDAAMSESQKTLSDDELDAVISDLYRKGMSPREFWNKATSTLMAMAEEARQERALDAEPTTEEPSWFADFPDESGNQPTGGGSESQPVDQASSRPGIELAGQTPAELAKQEADRVAAEKAKKAASDKAAADEKAANDRAEVKRRSEAAASTFELGGDAMANLTGQQSIFDAPAPSPEKQQAAKDLNDALSDLADIFGKKFRANMMPEQEQKLFPVMVRVFDAAFRLGYHSFKDAARFVLQTIREKIGAEVADAVTIDHLQGAYIAMSGGKELATAKRDVVSVESKTELEQGNVPDERSGTDLERDSENAATENGVGKKGVRDGSGRDGGAGGPGVPGAETTGSAGSGFGIPGPEALADRAASDNEVYVGAPGVSPGASGDSVSQRGGDLRLDGPPIEPDAAKGIGAAATGRPDLARKIALQASAPTDPGASIADALPMLSAGQQEDVAKAERRFAVPDGYGMLFTNGTGTGKTFSGLGIIKRFSNAGKNNILIVVPNDKIIEDWQKSGRMLGLDISELKNTKDAGKGIVVTTYANMGANSELVRREWDLVVHDEAHHLMENSEARSTNALRTLRAITLHPDGANDRHAALYADEIMKLADLRAKLKNNIEIGKSSSIPVAEKERIAAENARLSESLALAEKRNRETQKIVREDVESRQGAVRPRALFLSFTPFAYEPSIDWANGYLFDYNEGRPSDKTESRGYNQGSNSDQFFMQHFGYRMRTGKLTQPDAKVDRGLMQRQFNAFLKKKGSLSGRVLDVEADYDRRFLLVESAIGQRIDEALEWFEDQGKKTNDKDRKAALRDVRKVIADKFDYQSRRYLLEAIKAQEVIPHIREHMAMGRKVVVFHDYNQGGGFNPFDMNERKRGAEFSESGDTDLINSVIREFKTEFKDLIGSDLFKASSPIANFQKQFPGVLLVNGMVPAKTRRENVARFQDDASGPQLILVQSQAGKEGISLHDTTGKHQRVLFNLGQPTQPTMAMQQEGRIYRMGQVTDAIIRYLNTGTNWERWAFATTIAQRASAAENLGSGELARALKDAFISGFEESGNYRAGMEDEGKGGKARDAAANNVLSEYDRAKAFYFGTQKKDSRTKAQEGTDYYATPEPIGLKMVEFADIRAGDDVLEPSAGHGAIARWIPEHAKRTAIEPSTALRSRLAMVFDGNIIGSNFEDLNVVNKFDAIVMNPPFGTGGKTAVDHLAKAATHLRDGGRIVALLPTGPAADKRLDKWINGGEEVVVKPLVTHPELGPIYKGDTIMFGGFGGVLAQEMIVGAVHQTPGAMYAIPKGDKDLYRSINLIAAENIKPTGQRTEIVKADNLYLIADIQLPAVTFERAGTGVRTHIVVLEKQTNKDKLNTVPQKISLDYSDAENINTLFDRIENAFVRPRENARKEESAQTKAPSVGAQGSEKVRPDGGPATVEKMLPGGKLLTDAPKITYTTKAGKKLDGVIARTLTNGQATAIDPFTWPKDGGFFIRIKHVVRPESNNETRYNLAAGIQATPADRAVYDMAQEGKSAAEILEFIGKASRRTFNRYLANALKNLGASSTITLDSQGGWRFGNTSRAQKYAAAYNSRTDTVALSTAREAERHILHELVHAATMKAIKAGGPAAVRMRALFKHVQKSGKVNGQYGMSNLDEFVAEAFTNPKFQEALKGVPAPAGSTLKSAWQWFVNIVARVLGFKTSVAKTALDRAMTIGAQLMRENAAVMAASEDTRYAIAWHGTPHVWGPEPGFPHGRPRLDKIGTGEGAQAYGWGWYSAQENSVAKAYKDALKTNNLRFHVNDIPLQPGTDEWAAARIAYAMDHYGLQDSEIEREMLRSYVMDFEKTERLINEFRWRVEEKEDLGSLYQLDIPDDVMPKLLDWDKPMSRQPKDVQASLRRLYDKLGWRWNDSQTGNVIYETLTGDMLGARNHGLYGDEGSKAGEAYDSVGRKTNHLQAASEYLASLGIPGLRYLDGTSRNKGEGSYNYVIWDQKVLDRIALLERNGEKLDAIRAAEETRYSLDGSQPFDGREVATTPLKPGTTTLMVDGTERPALNSNGKPIHWSEEGVRNFWRWFSGSKVVDAQGRPLVVYHGTRSDFKIPKTNGAGLFFVTADVRSASEFSDHRPAARVMSMYASIKNIFDASDKTAISGLITKGRADGWIKGDIAHLTYDSGPHQISLSLLRAGDFIALESREVVATIKALEFDGIRISERGYENLAVFGAEQVKSSTGNTGAFSPDDPDIRYSLATDWYDGPSGAPVRNAWQRAKAKAAEILSPKNLDKIIYELQDKHIDLRRLRDHIQAIGGTITDMNDAYLGEELYHKRLAHRTDEFLKTELRPLLAEMKARGVSIQDLETFLHARHAPEANAEMARRNPNQAEIDAGQKKSATLVLNLEKRLQNAKARGSATVAIEQALNDARGKLLQWNGAQAFRGTEEERRSLSGLSDADAAAIMNGLTPERRAAMDTLAARVDAINEGTLQHLQHYGLMSRESLDTWRKTYRYYVPLHRDEAHPDSANHPIGQGFSVKGDAAKRRTGSNQQVTNILGHIAMQREAALTRGEKNHVMRKLYLMARQNPLPDVWKVGEVPMIDTIDKETGFVRTVPDPLYKTRTNVIMLRVAGKDVAIVMNEHNPQALRMAQALKNLDVDDLHYLIPVVGKMTRYFASINTQYNPIFGVINLMRDTQEAALNLSTTELSGKQKEVMTDTLSILKEVLKNKGRMPKTGAWATLFEEFNRVGGTTGYRDLFLDAESRSKSLLDELKALDRGKVSQAWNGVKEWLSDYNEAMENATRLAAYKAALDNGMSKERAASLAKNLTVNFNRKGRQTRELGALYAFFNAAVQGTTRMAQTLAGPAGRKIMAGGVMLGVMNALLGIAAMGGGDGEDDEWEKIPEFIKERSIVIPTGKDSYLSLPMPLGFQFLPNIGRLAVEMAVYKDKTAGKQMVALFQVLADAFNPMGGSSPPMQIAAPTVLDPFVALAQNKDWTGKPIFIENRNSLDPKPGLQRSKDSATPWAKGVAEAINAITGGTKYTPGGWSPTPDQIDFVIGQLTGGIGREAGKVAATATAPFTGDELPPYKIPLVGRLYGSTAGHSGQSEKFYENVTKANEVENEIKGRVRDGISVADYLADHPGAISLAARGNVAERQVAALRKARHAVTMKGGADEVSKVRAINERIANVMRNFNRDADLIGKRSGQ